MNTVNLVSKKDRNAAFIVSEMGMQDCFVIRPSERTFDDPELEHLADYFFERQNDACAYFELDDDFAFTTDTWFMIDRRELDELTEIADEGYVIGYDRDFTYNPAFDFGVTVF